MTIHGVNRLLLITFVILCVFFEFGGRAMAEIFNTNRWMAYDRVDGRDESRQQMLGDLTGRHLKVGMLRDEVRRLLGPPDTEFGRNRWRYDLGRSAFGVDFDYLVIDFGRDETVTALSIARS